MFALTSNKATSWVGNILFVILGAFALVYYKERMLHFDPSFFSFMVLQEGAFSIALDRWGSALSQLLPLIAIYKGIGLDGFLQLFSVSFIGVFYAVFLVLHYGVKNKILTWTYFIYLVLAFRLTFYYATAELYIGTALAFLLPVILHYIIALPKYKYGLYVLFVALTVFLSYFHQLVLFPALFLMMFFWKKGAIKIFPHYAAVVFAFVWFVIRVKFLSTSTYEQDKLGSSGELLAQIPHIFSTSSYIYFKLAIWPWIKWIFLLGLGSVFGLVVAKKYWQALLAFGFPVGFWFLWVLAFSKGESEIMYQNYFSLYGLFVGLPLVVLLWEGIKIETVKFAVPVVLVLFSLFQIKKSSNIVEERTRMIERFCDYGAQLKNRKYMLSLDNQDRDLFSVPWAFAFETLLFSSTSSPADGVTFYATEDVNDAVEKAAKKENPFLGPHFAPTWFQSSELNSAYFSLGNESYQKLNTLQDFMGNDSLLVGQVAIGTPIIKDIPNTENVIELEVPIENHSQEILRSIPGKDVKILLSYHVYDNNGGLIAWENNRTKLEVDLHPNTRFIQRLKIPTWSLGKGSYRVKIDLVTEGVRWWNLNKEIIIVI